MNNNEYQIFVGCDDFHLKKEYVHPKELIEMITSFFKRYEVDFSLYEMSGGYLYSDGKFTIENGVCLSLIGIDEESAIRLTKALKMFMNQENCLLLKSKLESRIM